MEGEKKSLRNNAEYFLCIFFYSLQKNTKNDKHRKLKANLPGLWASNTILPFFLKNVMLNFFSCWAFKRFCLVKAFKKSMERATFWINSTSCHLWKQDTLCLLSATNILRSHPQLLCSRTAPVKPKIWLSTTTSVFPNANILSIFPLLSTSFPLKKMIFRTAKHTIAFIPSGKRNRLYKSSTVSFWPTSHSRCRSIGPVSKPSSAQKIVNPAFLSPWIKVLDIKKDLQ